MDKIREYWQAVVDFMTRDLQIAQMNLKMWMLFAAGAAILLIVLVLILVISGRKRKKQAQQNSFETMPGFQTEMGVEAAPDEASAEQPEGAGEILSIGDEPTVNLDESPVTGGLIMEEDGETTDIPGAVPEIPQYLLQIRMFYNEQYANESKILTETAPITIGRGEAAQIQTNPKDTSVSHAHGRFYVQDDAVYYADLSRNGTVLNSTKTLKKDSIQLPLNVRLQMEIGTHKIWVLVTKK